MAVYMELCAGWIWQRRNKWLCVQQYPLQVMTGYDDVTMLAHYLFSEEFKNAHCLTLQLTSMMMLDAALQISVTLDESYKHSGESLCELQSSSSMALMCCACVLQEAFTNFMGLFLARLAEYHEGDRKALAYIRKAQAAAAEVSAHLGKKATVSRGRAIEAAMTQMRTLEAVVCHRSSQEEEKDSDDLLVVGLLSANLAHMCTTSLMSKLTADALIYKKSHNLLGPNGTVSGLEK